MEIVRGIWIGDSSYLSDTQWCAEHNISAILNCNESFEIESPVDSNYLYIEKTNLFIQKSLDKIYEAHYKQNKKCLVICENGKRMSVLIAIYYISKYCGVSIPRAHDLVKTKVGGIEDSPLINKYLAK